MNVSVIIPVYNAEKFIRKAIESALQFDCVKEVILVEDGSPDNALELCQKIVKEDNRVKLFQHPNGENRGASTSRNLGLKKATQEYIAFLDADDFFLPNRFDIENEILHDKTIDGVYHAIGLHFYSESAENLNFFKKKLTTLNGKVEPSELAYVLLNAHPKVQGHFSMDGLTVKRSKIENVGYFNDSLGLYEDTDLCMKLALTCNLVSGSLDVAVALRGVHEENRISKTVNRFDTKVLLYQSHLEWVKNNNINPAYIEELGTVLKCYRFLDEGPHGLLKTISYTLKNKDLFFRNRRFIMLVSKDNSSERKKQFVIRLKEKIVLLFFKKQLEKYI